MPFLHASTTRIARTARRALLAAASLGWASGASAIDFGPFSLTGFAKVDVTRISSECPQERCQVDKFAGREFEWADELVQGVGYGAGTTHVTLFQPYLGARFDLPRGFKLSGLLSQRWRDGAPDFKGFLYDRSLALAHEDYGRLSVGAMQTRAWSMADYPFGTDIGVGDPWASSGAGYGLLTRALRYTSRPFDVAEGDLVVEGTYDLGKRGWTRNKPRFWELWLQYRRGDLGLDLMLQEGRNGPPVAFGHAPFSSLFYDARFDQSLGGSSQGIAMLMARYKVDARVELSAGVRANRWSGAYAVFLQSRVDNPAGFDIWNNPFNVNWGTDLGGGVYRGYAARSVDLVLGARYRVNDKLALYTGLVHLGKASTDNPQERGQSNSASFGTLGLNYDVGRGLRLNAVLGFVNYGRRGLAPLSMPSHQAFTGIDSRVERNGNWFGVGATYTF
ncbi:hypothetical protein ABXN37_19250 [Piscinibacter sakaiensis]|uniref:Outer membrane protein n=1 Tax=Piscinibacter sakaiensis TaxID=1547922 RepID=A0A0K8P515_PISS1|nr:hypothetical protein [Piscinibacter sakaiensis]GAP37265.1 hypothetical protein ISF6_3120 [Piscinibacter sakaiensis]